MLPRAASRVVPVKLSGSFALFSCGRCGRSYANPLGHVCTVRMDRRTPPRKTRLAVRATVTRRCPRCDKPAANPLTHVCVVGSDWKRRKAAAAKRRKAAARASVPRHLYQSCRDKDCKRLPCVAWKEGREEGFAEGEESGYAKGYAAGAKSCG